MAPELDPLDPALSRVATRGPLPAIVLTGGGARGAYQAGALAGIAEVLGRGTCPFPVVTGVSAGAINATALAAGRGTLHETTSALIAGWLDLTTEQVFESHLSAVGTSAARWAWALTTGGLGWSPTLDGLLDTGPLRGYLGRIIDVDGIQRNIEDERLWALALSATSYRTGHTVTFLDGVPGLRTWERARRRSVRCTIGLDHVMASAALPIVFPAVRVEQDFYGDGSIRQSSPLAPAVHVGADRVLAVSVRHEPVYHPPDPHAAAPPPAQILGAIMNGVFLDALEDDAERLDRINRTLDLFPADFRHPKGLRSIRLLVLRPSVDLGELAHGLGESLPRGLRTVLRGMGAGEIESPDVLSYLLFERPFVEQLVELGRRDALGQADEIREFLEPTTC